MTREQTKELLPIMQAYAEGKTIQYKYLGKWEDVVSEAYFETYPFTKYRIKPEPKYRPFKTQEECWQEMQKHQPFGWVRTIISDNLYQIESISHEIFCNRAFTSYKEAFSWFKFADGEPFGIKEE